jgi:hypothetical protein
LKEDRRILPRDSVDKVINWRRMFVRSSRQCSAVWGQWPAVLLRDKQPTIRKYDAEAYAEDMWVLDLSRVKFAFWLLIFEAARTW